MQIEVKDKEAFLDLQAKLNEHAKTLSQLKAKIQSAEREKKRSELTLKELEQLPTGTRTYKAVGKTFLLTPSQTIKTELSNTCSKTESEVSKLTTQAKYVEKQMDDTEASAKELIISVRK